MFAEPPANDHPEKTGTGALGQANQINGIPVASWLGPELATGHAICLDDIKQACLSIFQKQNGQKCRSDVAFEQRFFWGWGWEPGATLSGSTPSCPHPAHRASGDTSG